MNPYKYLFWVMLCVCGWIIMADWGVSKLNAAHLQEEIKLINEKQLFLSAELKRIESAQLTTAQIKSMIPPAVVCPPAIICPEIKIIPEHKKRRW